MAFVLPWRSRKGPPSTTAGERIYAIGDVHGRYDLLRVLLDRIAAHSASLPPAQSQHIIQLGDMVDRGPDSARVVEHLHDLQQRAPDLIVLQGNHEEMMLRAYDAQLQVLRPWLGVGGRETLASFGMPPLGRDADDFDYVMQMRRDVPAAWVEWIRQLPCTAQSGDYFFCHAGIRPGVPLKRQNRQDLLWIREDFLSDTRDHGAVIVHGHSISPEVEMLENRIGIDTGAYDSDILTALYLEGTDRLVIATTSEDAA
ncbi:metallophosphoesterase family protein [Sphingomonas prati]|uniref:Serine/threonine protein phosphatase 1 n=1 Tax=Sphingomonas prati TaxID=1843237 RepID=A0A7W9BSL0_9SPHN|nr:metallophosphoesterase family protein [Sphingomonas prati]MBB5729236.1 serine/threonine protein phosphatase 1 [Sphingomonas prati]GGE84061.1 metallophosphatase [Sphingomonas prati]